MGINSFLVLLAQNGLGIILLFMVGYLIISQTLQFKALNGRMDRIEGRMDRIEGRLDKHEQQCEKRHKEFIDYMKDHEGRIGKLEGRLDEKQQPTT